MKKAFIYIFSILLINSYFIMNISMAETTDFETTDEEVVVTATRTARPVSQSPGITEITTKEEIENRGAGTVAEAIAADGITVAVYGGTGGVASVQLDGSSAEQTLVLVNGIAANTGCAGSADLSYFPTVGIRKIETVHGPLSALYGSSALGGVVNIITDLTGTSQNRITLSGGSFNSQNWGAGFQQPGWGIAAGGSFTGGYRERSQTQVYYLTGQYNLVDAQDQCIKLYWQYLSRYGEIPGGLSYPLPDAEQNDQNCSVNLNGKSQFWLGQWEYKVYSQFLDNRYYEFSIPYRHQTWNNGVDCAGFYDLGNQELLAGLSLKHQYFDSTNSGNHTQNDGGIFLQDSLPLNKRLTVIAGVRYDYSTNYQSPLSPRISLNYDVNDFFTVKCGYGKAFRAPTINELYWDQPAFGMYGNSNLKPEEGERFDLIGEWKQKTQSFTADLYLSNVTNGIKWVDPEGDFTYTVANIDKMKTYGLNLNWEKAWNEQITGTIGYQWLDERAWEEASQYYSKNMNTFGENQLNLGLRAKFKLWQCQAGWKLVTGRSNQMPDYNVMNLSLNYQPNQNLAWVLAVDNLTNHDYQVIKDYPMPGVAVKLSMNYTY